MIHCYNSYDTLKEIILGDVDCSIINLMPDSEKDYLNTIFEETQNDLSIIEKTLVDLGVTVKRPKKIKIDKEISTPYWKSTGLKIPLSPRDNFLIVGDTIIETASWQRERFFESFNYRDIFLDKLQNGAKWFSMPFPRHDVSQIDSLDSDIPNLDPMLDAACILKYNDTLFVSTTNSANKLGIKWLHNTLGKTYKIIEVDSNIFRGHLDTHFNILRPGLLISYHPRSNLPDFFKTWDIIQVDPKNDQTISKKQTLIDEKIQDDDFNNTVLAVNVLSIDQNTVMMYDHYKSNYYLIEQFKKYQIDIIFVPFRFCHFFNQGLTCITLETIRIE